MGKKVRKPNKHSINSTTLPNTTIIEPLLAKFDLPEANFFAMVTQSVDCHRLRIFDTHNNVINNEFHSIKEDKFTCLTWGKLFLKNESGVDENQNSNGQVNNGNKLKNKRKQREFQQGDCNIVIALGLQNGSIAFYSIAHGAIIKTLKGSHTLPINDFVFFTKEKKGYSCSDDSFIVEWDLEKFKEIGLLSTNNDIKLWDLETKKVIKTFTGHASIITNIIFSNDNKVCVSSAEHDRYINVWRCQNDNNDDKVNDNNNKYNLTKNTYLYGDNMAGKQKFTTRTPDSTIKTIKDEKDGVSIIPILSACFVDQSAKKETGLVLIARGSTVKPIFERVRFTDEETGEFQKELKLSRHQPMGLLNDESNLAAKKLKVTHKEYDELTANVILPNNQIHDISISNGESDMININSGLKNFENLNLSNNHKNNGNRINSDNNSLVEENRKIQKPQANSMQQVLVQALHSSDEHLLKEVLGQTNLEIINNTMDKICVNNSYGLFDDDPSVNE
ncbi:16836_t:CDS:2 [Entrophospora sp. SA101]|nr:16836_t:CDS:2 [Entrophospora sp. SA101]